MASEPKKVETTASQSPVARAESLRRFDEKWYPLLASRAIGERELGHDASAERWNALCRDLRALVALSVRDVYRLDVALGVLEDHDLLTTYKQTVEELETEARAQAMEP